MRNIGLERNPARPNEPLRFRTSAIPPVVRARSRNSSLKHQKLAKTRHGDHRRLPREIRRELLPIAHQEGRRPFYSANTSPRKGGGTPGMVSREGPAQRQDHVCTCLSGHPDRCSAPVHLCACCTGNFAACRATAHNCNCTTMISLLSSRTIPCRTVWKDAVAGTRSRRWRGASGILFPHRCRAHVHRCRCDNPSHKCLSRVHKCICGTVLGKCLKHPNRKK